MGGEAWPCAAVPRSARRRSSERRFCCLGQGAWLMAKEELMQFEGLVLEILPDARYRVQLDSGHEIVAYTAGKMKKNRIKTLAGDRVTVEMSPYDLEKGRLIFRHKDERPSGVGGPPRPGQRGGQFRRR